MGRIERLLLSIVVLPAISICSCAWPDADSDPALKSFNIEIKEGNLIVAGDGSAITNASVDALVPYAPRIRKLNLRNTHVDDHSLHAIASFNKLESLDLSGSPITGKGIERLRACPKLEVVFLEKTKFASESLPALANLSAKTVYLFETPMKYSEVEKFVLSEGSKPEIGWFPALSDAEQLARDDLRKKGISISFTVPTEPRAGGRDGFLQNKPTRFFYAVRFESDSRPEAADIDKLAKIPDLYLAWFKSGKHSAAVIRSVAAVSNIQELRIEVDIDLAALSEISKLPKIQKIVVHRPKMTEMEADRIREISPKIEVE